jgi:hypothetical protein
MFLQVCWYDPGGIDCAWEIPNPTMNITATAEHLKIPRINLFSLHCAIEYWSVKLDSMP